MAREQVGQHAEVHKRRRADFEAIGRAAAATADIKAQLALWIFSAEIDFARRRVDALCDHDEMVSQFFHAREHLLLGGHEDLSVIDIDGTTGKHIQALPNDAHTLAHFFHAHEITIVAIAFRADRHIEFHLVINEIGVCLAQIEIHAAAAQVWTGNSVIDCFFLRQDAYVLRAVDEDAVALQEVLRFIKIEDDFLEELAALLDPTGRQIAGQSADASVAGGEARAGERFAKIVYFFTFCERVHEHGQRADIQRKRAKAKQMRGNPRQLATDDADKLAAWRQLLVDT